jgi:hypothetical protein
LRASLPGRRLSRHQGAWGQNRGYSFEGPQRFGARVQRQGGNRATIEAMWGTKATRPPVVLRGTSLGGGCCVAKGPETRIEGTRLKGPNGLGPKSEGKAGEGPKGGPDSMAQAILPHTAGTAGVATEGEGARTAVRMQSGWWFDGRELLQNSRRCLAGVSRRVEVVVVNQEQNRGSIP